MRHISFKLTSEQILARTKTVTRRVTWTTARRGQILQPVYQTLGIPRGGTVRRLGCPINFVDVRRECLSMLMEDKEYGRLEMIKEGFPGRDPADFVYWFAEQNHCEPTKLITRIEFDYRPEYER